MLNGGKWNSLGTHTFGGTARVIINSQGSCTTSADAVRITQPPVAAAPAPVAKTGQTISYDDRDDGELERGVAWPNPRFTDNGDGTVRDNLTKLIWDKYARRKPEQLWDSALADCNALADGAAGLNDGSAAGDWRLPNVRELTSIIHYGFYAPSVPNTTGTSKSMEGDPFIRMLSSDYWTSTSNDAHFGYAWTVNPFIGIVDVREKYQPLGAFAWCVRDPK